ncbi:MAG: exosortase-associated EpsI family protein [Pirellulales bacterium]|nr:exosortase-associated EpsI family protein [Pirellulales bacterium]
MKKFILPVAVVIVMMAACTVLQGRWSERWGAPATPQLNDWTARLQQVPLEFGDWEGQEVAGNPEQLKASGAVGGVGRAYKNRETGDTVSVFLVCGTSRKVTAHTPDKCYVAAGFRMGPINPDTVELDAGSASAAQFFTAPFQKNEEIESQRIRILWGWSADGDWIAPGTGTTHKIALSRYPALFKLYVFGDCKTMEQSVHETACDEFVRDFIPVLNEVLFDTPATADAAAPANPAANASPG